MPVTTTANIALSKGWASGADGWGAAMNSNLERIDAISVPTVLPGESIQDAIDALDPAVGNELRLGAGTHNLTATLTLDHPITLRGAGQYSTTLQTADDDLDIVAISGSSVSVRDLCIAGPATAGTGRGIYVRSEIGDTLADCIIHNVRIQQTGSWGIYLCGQDGTEADPGGDVVGVVFHNVTVWDCKSGGAVFGGSGVAAPLFKECYFTAKGYTPSGIHSWRWHDTLPSYLNPALDPLPLGEVYLFDVAAALFTGCAFQLAGATDDTPVISFETCNQPRVEHCYFECSSATNLRTNWLVTMSHTRQFVFRDNYMYSPQNEPVHFMHTNDNASSECSGLVDGLYVIHGDTAGTHGVDDFVFNSAGDGGGNRSIILKNIEIRVSATGVVRDPSVTQSGGTHTFAGQNVLLQNAGRRFRVPFVEHADLAAVLDPKQAELLYVKGQSADTGGLGGLMIAADHASWVRIPTLPLFANATARDAVFTGANAPVEADLCYLLDTHKLQIYDGSNWVSVGSQ